MASSKKLGKVRYGVLIPESARREAFFMVRPNLIRLFKDCGKDFNYIPHGNEIFEISRSITQEENDDAYHRWLKWHNSGGEKKKRKRGKS